MHQVGGYIVHQNALTPIARKALCRWETEQEDQQEQRKNLQCEEENQDERDVADQPHDSSWYLLEASEASPSENKFAIDNGESWPFLDQLLFVHKPSELLTLPGIGPHKQTCLASLVNDWLEIEKAAINSQGFDIWQVAQASALFNTPPSKKQQRKQRKDIGTHEFVPRPCHRLDYDTSGVLVFGLTRDALRLTNTLFQEESLATTKLLQKTYVALVAGHVANDTGVIDYPIGKIYNAEKDFNEFVCLDDASPYRPSDFVDKSLRKATTKWTVLQRFSLPVEVDSNTGGDFVRYTRIQLQPQTGRGHQLRLHMASIGHYILGDRLHAPTSIATATPRLCLHAETLEMGVRMTEPSGSKGGIDSKEPKHYATKIKVESIPPF
eukprot:CAMPEP_0172448852 /NCGR_PEP_ID=MMETSP1065-20121228/7766_1 /TAXON_ID=265537 /ORGANISM="Amphiprora paludosa, Strain CCMP125" /LENGTH=380 /DNA_ID=CAMNT_0013200441 /DNA_START=137 /DNA_END=1279 /DNA_ORIENTATION=-